MRVQQGNFVGEVLADGTYVINTRSGEEVERSTEKRAPRVAFHEMEKRIASLAKASRGPQLVGG